MNDTRKTDNTHNTEDNAARLAPHLEANWRDDFVLELRMLDVPGHVIGDALATANSHVVESGESAQDAFGDPKGYARETAKSTSQRVDTTLSPGTVLGTLAGILGALATIGAFLAWRDGEAFTVTTGLLGGLAVTLLFAGLLLVRGDWALRFLMDRPVAAALLFGAVPMMLVIGLAVVGREPVLQLNTLLVGVLGVLLLGLHTFSAWQAPEDDPISGPGESRSLSTGARLRSALLIPAAVLGVVVILWFIL